MESSSTNNKRWLPFLGFTGEATANVGCLVQEQLEGKKMYAHWAHAQGFSIGLAAAFVLDQMFRKKQPLI